MPAGLARLEVKFHVDENSLLAVTARELTTGNEQTVEVKPSHGLDDETVERMLIEALDHGEDDLMARRLAETKVEGQRVLLATNKALAADADLLTAEQLTTVRAAIGGLQKALAQNSSPGEIQNNIDALDAATHDWAGRRMDRAIAGAIAGRQVASVEEQVAHAAGVEAHLQAHASQGKAH
jgi:molecular chaperone HscA